MELPEKSRFSEWFNELIFTAGIMDVRYPVKGIYVWMPFGFRLRRKVYDFLRCLLDRDHDEVLFPLLIPEQEFMKEAEHIKGFEDEVYWVTHGGMEELDVKLALRPTSETAMYPIFNLWIRTHADLPLKIYQIVNVFRYETKHTRPLIRLREVTSFKEAHTVHATMEEAEKQVESAVKLYKEFFDTLGIPYLIFQRPEWDKFPGAVYTLAFDTIMPDGRTLQIGTVHNLGSNFSKTFDIKFETSEGDHEYACQTCYGISERCIAALIAIHGDDSGLVLPFEFAPIQAVIIPVLFKGEKRDRILEKAEEIKSKLEDSGWDVVIDDSELRPGAKYYRWELRGVPLRIEIGPSEIEKNSMIVSFRDEREKIEIDVDDLERLIDMINEYDIRLKGKSRRFMEERIRMCSSLKEAGDHTGRGVALVGWCGETSCGEEIENRLESTLLGILKDGYSVEKAEKCIVCEDEARYIAGVARTF